MVQELPEQWVVQVREPANAGPTMLAVIPTRAKKAKVPMTSFRMVMFLSRVLPFLDGQGDHPNTMRELMQRKNTDNP